MVEAVQHHEQQTGMMPVSQFVLQLKKRVKRYISTKLVEKGAAMGRAFFPYTISGVGVAGDSRTLHKLYT